MSWNTRIASPVEVGEILHLQDGKLSSYNIHSIDSPVKGGFKLGIPGAELCKLAKTSFTQ